MLTILSILIFLACCFLVLAVLVQNPKGGGLASGFQSGAQVMGVRRTADFLEKATWGLAIAILFFSIISTSIAKGNAVAGTDDTQMSTTKDKAGDFDAGSGQPAVPSQGVPIGTPAPPPTK